jgi:GGDEF domain-containing protein
MGLRIRIVHFALLPNFFASSNSLRRRGWFAGHIGGDDFVFIVTLENAENVCKKIIANFNIIVSDLFGDEKKTKAIIQPRTEGELNRRYLCSGLQ